MESRQFLFIASFLLFVLTCFFNYNEKNSLQNYQLDNPSPSGRAEWRAKMRGYSASPQKIIETKNILTKRYKKERLQKDGGLSTWTELNNHEEGGRVRALAAHPTNPNILFCGGASGGLWKSTNAGASWSPVSDLLPSLSITTIIIDPSQPNRMFISTGETITTDSTPGAGIFRSNDGGDTWEIIPALQGDDFDSFYWIQSIAIDPDDSSVMYAGKNGGSKNTSNDDGELWKFENFGATKTQIVNIPVVDDITRIVVNPEDGDNIAVCTENNLIVTQNGGLSWINVGPIIANNGRIEVAFDPSDEDNIYLLSAGSATGSIYKSENKGSSWSSVRTGLTIFTNAIGGNQGWYNNTIWVDPLYSDRLILGGIDLWNYIISTNTLTKISDQTQHNLGLSAHADHHIIVPAQDYGPTNRKVYFGNDGGIASTDNITSVTESTGWNLLNNGLNITQYYNSDIQGLSAVRIIAGSQDNGTMFTEDGGSTWSQDLTSDGGYCAISRQDPSTQYASKQRGDFHFRTGAIAFSSYFDLTVEQGSEAPFITPMAMYPNDGNQIIVGGEKIYHIEYDPNLAQKTVTEITPSSPPSSFYDVSAITISDDGEIVLVGYSDGSVWRYFGDITIAPALKLYQHPSDRPVTSIALHPSIEGRVAISIGGYYEDNVLIGENIHELFLLNMTWEVRDNGIANVHVNDLEWHPTKNNWLYAGTDFGIMATEDNGSNWNISPNFMNISDGPVFTEVSKLQFTGPLTLGGYKLVATTYGRGIWITEDPIRDEIWLDHSSTSILKNGFEASPYKEIEDAESVQAHGQTWHIKSGTYTKSGTLIIDKRIGAIEKEGNGAITIGEN